MQILNGEQVRAMLSMQEAIAAVRTGFIALSTGRAIVPQRSVMPILNNRVLTMPAYIEGSSISAIKVVSVCPQNPERQLETVIGQVLVLDAATGVPLALLDGEVLTAIRTGAASGLATDLLARTDASILGVIGAGTQARTQVEAICCVRAIREIRIFSRSRHSAEVLAVELRQLYTGEISAVDRARTASLGADVLVVATNSKTPVIDGDDVLPGTHINGIGSFTPEMQEVAAALVLKSKIVVDSRQSAWAEAGDLIIPRNRGQITEDAIHGELGEIAAGLLPGRENDSEIAFFKSVGNAVQDAAVAECLIRKLGQSAAVGKVSN